MIMGVLPEHLLRWTNKTPAGKMMTNTAHRREREKENGSIQHRNCTPFAHGFFTHMRRRSSSTSFVVFSRVGVRSSFIHRSTSLLDCYHRLSLRSGGRAEPSPYFPKKKSFFIHTTHEGSEGDLHCTLAGERGGDRGRS